MNSKPLVDYEGMAYEQVVKVGDLFGNAIATERTKDGLVFICARHEPDGSLAVGADGLREFNRKRQKARREQAHQRKAGRRAERRRQKALTKRAPEA